MVGVVVGDHHVGNRALRLAEAGEWAEDVVAAGYHPRINDDMRGAIADIGDGRGDAAGLGIAGVGPGVACGQDVYLRSARKLERLVAVWAGHEWLSFTNMRFMICRAPLRRLYERNHSLLKIVYVC